MDTIKNKEAVEKIKEEVNEAMGKGKVEEIIQNNEMEFEYKDHKYRIKKISSSQRQTIYEKRVEKHTEFLQATNQEGKPLYMLEKDLIEVYKKRGTDIGSITKRVINANLRKESLLLKLGESLDKKAPDNQLKVYKDEIQKIDEDIQSLNIEKSAYLQYSLESQVLVYLYMYLTFILVEKKEGDTWVRAWKEWKEIENEEGDLINLASMYVTVFNRVE